MGILPALTLFTLVLSLTNSIADDGLSDNDNPPGLEEYLKKLEQSKKKPSGFHVYSEEGKKALESDAGDFSPIVKKKKKKITSLERRQRKINLQKKQAKAENFRSSRATMMNKFFKAKFDRELFLEKAERRQSLILSYSKLFLEEVHNPETFAMKKGTSRRASSKSTVVEEIENYEPGRSRPRPAKDIKRRDRVKRFHRNVAEEKNQNGKREAIPSRSGVPPLKTKLQVFKPKERIEKTPMDFVDGLEFPTGTDPFLALIDDKNALRNDEVSKSRVKLGKSLFHDKNLSVDRKVSCASCHNPGMHFMDGQRFPVGVSR